MPTQAEVMQLVRSFAERKGKTTAVDLETHLYDGGIGLESLDAAELSALLESTFGSDPYTSAELPETVGDIVRFYET